MTVTRTIPTWTNHSSCIDAKRIYADSLVLKWVCPECHHNKEDRFNQVPLISYGYYCHVYYCDKCDFESPDKMYTLHKIDDDDSVELTFNDKHCLKAYRLVSMLEEI